jgi:uncharacterized protein YkwD
VVDDVQRRWRRRACAIAVAAAAAAVMPHAAPATMSSPSPVVGPATMSSPAAISSPSAAARRCRGAGARPSRARRSTLRAAILCLVNRERARRGIRPLRRHRRLGRAAARHARDMVRHRYFAHQRAGGPDLGTRLARAGWRGSAAGETIAYGCGGSGTPRAAVRGWMASPGHNAILLSGHYGLAGPGVAKRAPVSCRGGATWVLDVGRR